MSMARVDLPMPGRAATTIICPGWRPLVKVSRVMKPVLSPSSGWTAGSPQRIPNQHRSGRWGAEIWLPGVGALRQAAEPETLTLRIARGGSREGRGQLQGGPDVSERVALPLRPLRASRRPEELGLSGHKVHAAPMREVMGGDLRDPKEADQTDLSQARWRCEERREGRMRQSRMAGDKAAGERGRCTAPVDKQRELRDLSGRCEEHRNG